MAESGIDDTSGGSSLDNVFVRNFRTRRKFLLVALLANITWMSLLLLLLLSIGHLGIVVELLEKLLVL